MLCYIRPPYIILGAQSEFNTICMRMDATVASFASAVLEGNQVFVLSKP